MAVAALAFVAFQASPPEAPGYLTASRVRFVSPSVAQDVSSLSSTVTQPPVEVAGSPPPEGSPAAEGSPAPAEAEARLAEDCAVIRGRAYDSSEERDWFLANCLRLSAVRPLVNAQPLPAFAPTGVVAVEGGVSAIGDSVMVGAGSWLAATFAGIDIDAEVGRQVSQAIVLLRQRAADGTLARTVVLHLGNNGAFSSAQFDQIMEAVGPERRVYFINLHVPRNWEDGNNAVLSQGVSRYGNAYVIDWHSIVEGHDELFAADGVHIAAAGARLYAGLVVDAVTR
jgi:hypothetical protein